MKNRVVFKEFKEDDLKYNYVLRDMDETEFNIQCHDILIQIKACALSSGSSQVKESIADICTELLCLGDLENPGQLPVQQAILSVLFSKKPKVRLSAASSIAGIVSEVGSAVTTFKKGDRIAGVLPLDSDYSGCADLCVISEFDSVKLPSDVDFESAAAAIGDGVKAYTALQYLGKMVAGETVMVTDAATGFGSLVVQLANSWGAKVLAVVTSAQEQAYLQKLQHPPDYILELDNKSSCLCSSIMEETGKLGVDIIIDNGVKQFLSEEDSQLAMDDITSGIPTKHELISCLAVGGRWITSNPCLQLDPPNSMQLFLRCASISFLFDQSWNLSSAKQGRWTHMVQDIMNKLAQGSLRPHITQVIPFSQSLDALQNLGPHTFGKTVVSIPDNTEAK